MTEEEINEAIARKLGWVKNNEGKWVITNCFFPWTKSRIPDYCNDLNAIHDAVDDMTDEEYADYDYKLGDILCALRLRDLYTIRCHQEASALHRSTAAVKAWGLWKEKA